MKVIVFNTQHCENYVSGQIDYELMAEVIRNSEADIVGLNEIRGKGVLDGFDNQTEILSELTGIKNAYFAKAIDVAGENPYGNALLSKYEISEVQNIPVPDPEEKDAEFGSYESRCLIKAKLSCGLTVMVIHFGLHPDEQKNAVATVMKHLEKEKCILMGDFNVEPDDSVLAPIRAVMKDTADAFETPLKSFPSDEPNKKIDYIFVSPDIEVEQADIPAIVASDHRPHTATLQVAEI